MEKEYQQPSFKAWLNTLQQESWQLELIVSGFALYALFSAYMPVAILVKKFVALGNSFQVYLLTFVLISIFILILSLTLHVVLRGLWIGAIGLRYVSGEIEYDELRYTQKFISYLERKVGPYDKLISELEKYCSVIFASAFLTVFYILSLFIIIGLVFASNLLIMAVDSSIYRYTVQALVLLTLGIGAILTFIDFVTLGGLKRSKWLSKIYFPYYRVFSIITLSFLYRPIVYNLLDNKFGKRLARLVIPLYITILVIASLRSVNSNYVPANFEDQFQQLEQIENVASPLNYDDELGDDKFVGFISIPSKSIQDSYLPVFIPFRGSMEERLYEAYPELMPENDQRGLMTSIIRFDILSLSDRQKRTRDFLDKFSALYSLKIDGVGYSSDYVVTQNILGQSGFETYLDLGELKRGMHILTFVRNDESEERKIANVPFWYFPDE